MDVAQGSAGNSEQVRRLIVAIARELAEAEGWEAVSTRRLAERTACGQVVLYQLFPSREAIVAAVAVQGFGELAAALQAVRAVGAAIDTDVGAGAEGGEFHRAADVGTGSTPTDVGSADETWAAVTAAYLDFANANPALYDAMFLLTSDLPFGEQDSATPVQAAFDELRQTLAPLAAGRNVDAFTEVGWSTLHGMVMLTRGGRLRPDLQELREAVIRDQLLGPFPDVSC